MSEDKTFPASNPAPAVPHEPEDPAAGMEVSNTGAALGKPSREYGAYGLVIGKDAGPTPSADERAVRGVGPDALPVDKK